MDNPKKRKPFGCVSTTNEFEDEYERLTAILERNPNCKWAQNELKYMSARHLPDSGVDSTWAAEIADRQYHGCYIE